MKRMRIDLTDNCNIRCMMCQAYNGIPRSHLRALSLERFIAHTSGQLRDWTHLQLGHMAEPTLHPEFAEFVRYLRQETDAALHIVTNGVLLKRFAELFNEVKALVNVSIDSLDPDTYARIRPGSHLDRILQGLEKLDLTRCKVLITMVLMRQNVREYETFIRFCKERGYQLGVVPMSMRDDHGVLPTAIIDQSLWFDKAALTAWLERHYGRDYCVTSLSPAAGSTRGGLSRDSCRAHETDLVIYPSGKCMLCFQVPIGNIEKQTLGEIWHSEVAETFRQSVDATRGPCGQCDYMTRCLSPSLMRLENHVCAGIFSALPDEVRSACSLESPLSDDARKALFLRTVREHLAVCEIVETSSGVAAIPHTVLEACADRPLQLEHVDTVHAPDQAVLHALLQRRSSSDLHPTLVGMQRGYGLWQYRGRCYAVPQRLGEVDIKAEALHPSSGVLIAPSPKELEAALLEVPRGDAYPRTLAVRLQGYDWIEWGGILFALPENREPFDLLEGDLRRRPGVLHRRVTEHLPSVEALVAWIRNEETASSGSTG